MVVLLTDFGPSEYVGVMKGIVLAHAPGVPVVDLTHAVPPHAVREAAWILATSYRYFPSGAVFLAVVDPGVGTGRAAVAVRTRRYSFVGPDNGLLFPAAGEDGIEACVRLPVPPGASATFHGRDVFAPAAGRLAAGTPLAELGPPAELQVPLRFFRRGNDGEVVRVDPFGNVITNLPPAPADRYGLTVLGWTASLRAVRTYDAAPAGELVCLTGSVGTLELAVKQSSAARYLEARTGVAPHAGLRLTLAPEGSGPTRPA